MCFCAIFLELSVLLPTFAKETFVSYILLTEPKFNT